MLGLLIGSRIAARRALGQDDVETRRDLKCCHLVVGKNLPRFQLNNLSVQ